MNKENETLDPAICMDEWFKGMWLPRDDEDIKHALYSMRKIGSGTTSVRQILFYNLLLQKALPAIVEDYLVPLNGIPRVMQKRPSMYPQLEATAEITPEMDASFVRGITRGRLRPIIAGLAVISDSITEDLHVKASNDKKINTFIWNHDPILDEARSNCRNGEAAVARILSAQGLNRDALVENMTSHMIKRVGVNWGMMKRDPQRPYWPDQISIDWHMMLACDSE